MSFKNGVLEASGLDFGGPRARFWRVLGPFFRDLALLAGKIAGTDFELKAKAAQFQLGAQVGRSSDFYVEVRPRCSRREGGRRCPPPGGLRFKSTTNRHHRPHHHPTILPLATYNVNQQSKYPTFAWECIRVSKHPIFRPPSGLGGMREA